MQSEGQARSNLVRALHEYGENYFVYAIESGSTARGISDVYFMHNKRAYWIECKLSASDTWQGSVIDFRPLQQKFLFDHYKAGGYGVVYIRSPTKHLFASIIDIDETKRIIGKSVLQLNTLNVPVLMQWLEAL